MRPTIFEKKSELIDKLKSKETTTAVEEFFEQNISDISEIVRRCADGSTYRAFRITPGNPPIKPSDIFRGWANDFFESSLLRIKTIQNKDEYQLLVDTAAIDLCNHWDSQMCYPLGYGRGAKLLNLALKWLACLNDFNPKQKHNLIRLQHVPLDSYTIRALKIIAPELNIKSNETMTCIKTPERYRAFQNKIADITEEADTPAIYYDFVAWNLAHPE